MLQKGIKLAWLIIIVMSAVMAFLALRALDEVAINGASSTVWIREATQTVNTEKLSRVVNSVAVKNDVNIGRVVPDVYDPMNHNHLYLSLGNAEDTSANWIDEGYNNFSRNSQTEVHPFEQLGATDPRGHYLIFGDQQASIELLNALEDLGYEGQADSYLTKSWVLQYLFAGTMAWCFTVVTLIIIVIISTSVLMNTKLYGVQRMQGTSISRILARDLIRLYKFVVPVAATAATATITCLWLYNNGHQLLNYLQMACTLFIVLGLIALITHSGAVALTYQTSILGAVKGEVPPEGALTRAYILHIPVLIVAIAMSSAVVVSSKNVINYQTSHNDWVNAVADVSLIINGSTINDPMKVNQKVGSVLREIERNGNAMLVKQESTATLFPDRSDISYQDILFVNEKYLQRHQVLTPDGSSIILDQSVQVLVPQDRASEMPILINQLRSWSKFIGEDMSSDVPEFTGKVISSGQTHFTYGSRGPNGSMPTVRNPTIVAFPDVSKVIPPSQYTAYATSGGLIFTNSDLLLQEASDADIDDYILGVQSVSEKNAIEFRKATRDLRLQAVNFVGSIIALMATSLTIAIVYRRKYSQLIFVKFVSGWSFMRTHRKILVIEAAICIIVVSFYTYRNGNYALNQSSFTNNVASMTSGSALTFDFWALPLATTIAFASFAVTVLTLHLLTSQQIRKRSDEV